MKLTVLLPLKSGKLEKKGTETSRLFPISLTIPLETAGGMIEMIWQSGANLIVKVRKRCDKYVAICTLSLFPHNSHACERCGTTQCSVFRKNSRTSFPGKMNTFATFSTNRSLLLARTRKETTQFFPISLAKEKKTSR